MGTSSIVYGLLFLSVLQGVELAKPCVPKPAGFTWKPCRGGDPRLQIKDVQVTQGGSPVKGPIDSTRRVSVKVTYANKYGKIKNNKVNFEISKYAVFRKNGPCEWQTRDLKSALSGLDGCSYMSKADCQFAGNPTTVTYNLDTKVLYGNYKLALEPGAYYTYQIEQLDGSKSLACFWFQVVIK